MEGATTYLLTQGVLGVVCLGLVAALIKIYSELKDERKKNADLQEARRLDAVEVRTDVTSMLPGISQSLQNISDKIEISKKSKGY